MWAVLQYMKFQCCANTHINHHKHNFLDVVEAFYTFFVEKFHQKLCLNNQVPQCCVFNDFTKPKTF